MPQGVARAVALKDARTTGTQVTSGSLTGSGYNLSSILASGKSVYAALHRISVSGTHFLATIQSASSSGFGAVTTEFTFACSTSVGAVWATPVTVGSTDRIWWRTRWDLTSGVSGAAQFLDWVGIER